MDTIIKHEPLHIQVYNIIKNNIMNGEFKPGERIVESKLASQLGISRGPIREAIRMHIQDGLLIQGDSSIYVYNPTAQDIVDIFQCRESLETLAVTLSIKKMDKRHFRLLEKNIKRTKKILPDGEIDKLNSLDQEFHDIIIKQSNNKQLIQLMEVIKNKVIYIRRELLKNNLDKSFFLEGHEQIYNALLENDIETVQKLMKEHIQAGLDDLLEVIEKK